MHDHTHAGTHTFWVDVWMLWMCGYFVQHSLGGGNSMSSPESCPRLTALVRSFIRLYGRWNTQIKSWCIRTSSEMKSSWDKWNCLCLGRFNLKDLIGELLVILHIATVPFLLFGCFLFSHSTLASKRDFCKGTLWYLGKYEKGRSIPLPNVCIRY